MSDIISVSSGSDTGSAPTVLKSVKFIFISYIISVILLAVLAALIVYTEFPESFASPAVKLITMLGAFLSALLTARSTNAKGWLCGLITGAVNVAVLLLIGVFFSSSALFTASNLTLVACGALCGAVGGIIGVNLGKK